MVLLILEVKLCIISIGFIKKNEANFAKDQVAAKKANESILKKINYQTMFYNDIFLNKYIF